MSYKTYTTEAFVCGSHASNTSDKSHMLFTQEAGLIWATARSVREEKSKQRYALQDFSRIRVSLIKGKSGWRVGSAEALGNFFLQASTRSERALVNFVFMQLRRYVHGEIMLPAVYKDVAEVLEKKEHFGDIWSKVGQVFLLRLLSELGYIAPEAPWDALVSASSVEEAMGLYTQSLSGAVDRVIEEGRQASHL
jgi:recombinational DNA repair protein (RecF pathway)